MVKDQHLDADVFRLVLDSGIYKTYAERYLKPDKIDEVEQTEGKKSPSPKGSGIFCLLNGELSPASDMIKTGRIPSS
ncbi:hypothetical protein ACTVJH_10845 [Desulfoplanes sp. PS50]|jgi:hypothetical protein